MEKNSIQLQQLLANHIKLLKDLVASADTKKTYIIENKMDEIKSVAENEMLIVDKIKTIEEERQKFIDNLSKDSNKSRVIKFRDIAHLFGADQEEKLLKLYDMVKAQVSRLKIKNRLNETLLRHAANHIEDFYTMLFQEGTKSDVYTRKGYAEKMGDAPVMFLDKRA